MVGIQTSCGNTLFQKSNGCNARRLQYLSQPKLVHPLHLPDKPSTYWLDYIVDTKPLTMTNSSDLQKYYLKQFERCPRVIQLANPRVKHEKASRPTTKHGVVRSALSYQPNERILKLSKPKSAPGPESATERQRHSRGVKNQTPQRSATAIPKDWLFKTNKAFALKFREAQNQAIGMKKKAETELACGDGKPDIQPGFRHSDENENRANSQNHSIPQFATMENLTSDSDDTEGAKDYEEEIKLSLNYSMQGDEQSGGDTINFR